MFMVIIIVGNRCFDVIKFCFQPTNHIYTVWPRRSLPESLSLVTNPENVSLKHLEECSCLLSK